MDVRQLRYFVAVAEELNFSRAAERLNMSQPPLSIQIKAMEQDLGTVLLVRTRHSVALTRAGKLLLDHARTVLQDLDRASDLVRRAGRGEAGLIRMAFVGSVPMLDLFSYLLGGFNQRYPNVRVDLQNMTSARQIQALATGEIDVGFIRPSRQCRPGPGLRAHIVWTDRLKVFLPARHTLASAAGPVSIRALKDQDFIGIAAGSGCGVHDFTATACGAAGFVPRVVQETQDLRTVLWLVAAGLGISLLPECYDRAGVANVASRPLLAPHPESHISMVTRVSDETALLLRFVDHALGFTAAPRPAPPAPATAGKRKVLAATSASE
jgi:DNA-binding transcriptional LysR family regulator